jgi:YD repeat-containing protein
MGLEVHHITPRSKLGHDAEENLIAYVANATAKYTLGYSSLGRSGNQEIPRPTFDQQFRAMGWTFQTWTFVG